tara:strand:+ start:791 stop:1351 length:561 start_codon:yes stop_codon:yes gene_type:complete
MGKPQTPEHRAKIAAAMKAYHTTCKGEKGKKESTAYVAVGSAGAEAKKIKERLATAKKKTPKSKYKEEVGPIVEGRPKTFKDGVPVKGSTLRGGKKKKIKTKTKPRSSLPFPGQPITKPSRAEFAAQVVRFNKIDDEGLDEDNIDFLIMELADSLKENKARFGKTQGYADLKMWKASLIKHRDDNM